MWLLAVACVSMILLFVSVGVSDISPVSHDSHIIEVVVGAVEMVIDWSSW